MRKKVEQSSVKKNYIYSMIYQILTMIIPFATAPYLARVLGADGIGTYSYSLSCMTYFTMFAALGTPSYGMREIARCRNDRDEYSKKFWEIEILSILSTSICLLAWLVLIVLSEEYRMLFIGLIPMLIATMFDISWFYIGHEKVGYTVFINSLFKILGVVLIFSLVKTRSDIFLYILINSVILLLGNVSMWLFLPRILDKVNIKHLELRKHLKETLIYFIPTIATTVYTVLDKTLIGIITKDAFQNGYYEQAAKIVNMAKTMVFVSVNRVMEARISFLFVEKKIDEIKLRIEKSFSFIMFLAYGAMFGIMSIAQSFVPIFFGSGYDPVIELLCLMAPLIVIIGISNCLGAHYYTPAGYRAKSAKYLIVGSSVNFLLNIGLIPFMGARGAVIGSLVAEGVISFLYLKNCERFLTMKQIFKTSYKRIISGIIMSWTIWEVSKAVVWGIKQLLAEITIGIIVYFVSLLLMKDDLICDGIIAIRKKRLFRGNGG